MTEKGNAAFAQMWYTLWDFDILHPQTAREWALVILTMWPIAPIYLIVRELIPPAGSKSPDIEVSNG